MLSLGVLAIRYAARAFARDDKGVALVEYALILGLVAIGVIVALVYLSGSVANAFEMVSDNLEAVVTNQDPVQVGQHHGHGWCHNHGC